MKFTKAQVKSIVKKYGKGKSTYELAEEYDTYSQKIRRLLIKEDVSLRSKSDAQATALKTGRHPHPTEGTERDHETKVKISSAMVEYFDEMSEEEKEERFIKSKENWDKMPKHKKEEFLKKGTEAIRKTRDEGSKLERFVLQALKDLGFVPKFHDDQLIPGRDLQVDISIPGRMIAIEVDGPSHFLPIWGADKLRKQQKFDHDKDALITSFGFTIIRIGHTSDNLPLSKKEELIKQLDKAIRVRKKGKIVRIDL